MLLIYDARNQRWLQRLVLKHPRSSIVAVVYVQGHSAFENRFPRSSIECMELAIVHYYVCSKFALTLCRIVFRTGSRRACICTSHIMFSYELFESAVLLRTR